MLIRPGLPRPFLRYMSYCDSDLQEVPLSIINYLKEMRLSIARFASLLALITLTILASCKDDKDDDKSDDTSSSCTNGASFCMQYGSITKSGTAIYKDLSALTPNRHRIYFSKGNEQVEMDLYTNGEATLNIGSGVAEFEYFDGTKASSATSGTVIISKFDLGGDGISGTFELSMDDGTKVSNGHFINIKP